jgi:hypothetical protein
MAAGGTPANVDLGPGRIYVAPLGTAEPTSCSAALPSAWIPIGYTEDGNVLSWELTSEPIEVAEEYEPILYEQTRFVSRFSFQMAEATRRNLALALGLGVQANNAASIAPPVPGQIVPVLMVWDSEETPGATNRRLIMRRATPSSTTELARRKAPAKTLIPVTFDLARPDGNTTAWSIFPNSSSGI